MSAKDDRPGRGSPRPADWRQTLPAVTVLVAVVGVIGLTAILHVRDGDPATVTAPDGPPPLERGDVPGSDRSGGEDGAGSLRSARPLADGNEPGLEARVRRDTRRLVERGKAWTLQILVACDRGNVESLVERLDGADRMYVLPVTLDGRDCFRVCWDAFDSRASAKSSVDLPADVVRDLGPPTPKSVADLVP